MSAKDKILITGCHRGATQYIWRIMDLCGLKLGHESLERNGTVDWFAMYRDRQKKVGGPENFGKVIHQMRHPLNNIDSLRLMSTSTWEFHKQWISTSEKAEENRIQMGMESWYWWSMHGKRISHYRYRVEALKDVFEELCEFIGATPNWYALEKIPRNEHYDPDKLKFGYKYLTWKDMEATDVKLCKKIRTLAMEYGYPEESLYDS